MTEPPITAIICYYLPLCPDHYTDYLSKHYLSSRYPKYLPLHLYLPDVKFYTGEKCNMKYYYILFNRNLLHFGIFLVPNRANYSMIFLFEIQSAIT